jgi:hypothetical protein
VRHLVLASVLLCGCATAKSIPVAAGQAIVDCASQDKGRLLNLVLDFVSQLVAASSSWDNIETQAEAEGTSIGECAFVEVWTRFHPLPPVAARLAQTQLDKLRSHAGGVSWRLTNGTIK